MPTREEAASAMLAALKRVILYAERYSELAGDSEGDCPASITAARIAIAAAEAAGIAPKTET